MLPTRCGAWVSRRCKMADFWLMCDKCKRIVRNGETPAWGDEDSYYNPYCQASIAFPAPTRGSYLCQGVLRPLKTEEDWNRAVDDAGV